MWDNGADQFTENSAHYRELGKVHHKLRRSYQCWIIIVKQRRQESIYKVIELVGSSPISWEDAARNAIDTASKSLWNLRIGEVTELDVKLDDKGEIVLYRAKIKFSLKYDNWKVELGWKARRCSSSPIS